jgi:hypothetical protein
MITLGNIGSSLYFHVISARLSSLLSKIATVNNGKVFAYPSLYWHKKIGSLPRFRAFTPTFKTWSVPF